MSSSNEERSVMRRRLTAMHEEQLRGIACDIGLSPHVGDKASRSEWARNIVQFASASTENWQWLLRELEENYTTLLRADGQLVLSFAMEAKLYGVLRDVWQTKPFWVKTALAIAMDNIFPDRDYLKDTLENVLSPLTSLPQPSSERLDPTALPLTQFVILLGEISKKKGDAELSVNLREWLNILLAGTGLDWLAVAGRTVPLPKECVWAPAVEIAWNPYTISRLPEVYIRWAGLRQRIEVPASTASRRVQSTVAYELIEKDERYSRIEIDHVEVSVDRESISVPWELKNEFSTEEETVDRPRWPVTVRLCKSCGTAMRADHDGRVLDRAKIRSSLDEDELVSISITDGFFIALEHAEDPKTFAAFFVAAKKVSAAIWARTTIEVDKQQIVKETIHDKTLYELPSAVHQARFDCSKNSIWRQLVLFYDPNLPEFKFSIGSDNEQDREMFLDFQIINEYLS